MSSDSREQVVEAYVRLGGNKSAVARELDLHRSTVQGHIRAAGLHLKPLATGRLETPKAEVRPRPAKGKRRTFICTTVQNNTRLNDDVWDGLNALAEHDDAELLCASFSYNQNNYGKLAVKRGTQRKTGAELWFDERVEELLEKSDRRIQLAPGLMWCGEMNILPTAARPLSSLQSYSGTDSAIFPHVKVAMESIATGGLEQPKFNYTTGTISQRNYIQKKEGLKAEFHHVYGGMIVEVDADGTWFARQLVADKNGVICDLDRRVENGKVTTGNRVDIITWGDDHVARPDKQVYDAQWGKGGMLDTYRPFHSVHHDVLSFEGRNKHTIRHRKWHDYFATWCLGHDSVEKEVGDVAAFLDGVRRPWTKTVVVDSNHHNFMMEWLQEEDYRRDPINALYFLEAQAFVYRSIQADPERRPNILKWGVNRALGEHKDLLLLDGGQSYLVHGIENGAHGDEGPNGAYGSPSNFAKMAHKMNRGHEHSASIYDGVYTGGLSGSRNQGYNRGPSSWSASDIFTYANGKRAIITLKDGRHRAIGK